MITYEYDINDNLVKVIYPDTVSSEVQSLSYTYDSVTQNLTVVTKTTDTGSSDFRTYTYYADGKLKTTTANGITETYTYDDFGRTVSKVYTVSGAEKERHEYVYDKNSNIIEETIVNNWPASSSSRINETRVYTYDNLGQLLQSVVSGSRSETTTYEYDIVGNRKKETVGTTVTEYHYNSQNMLLEEIVTVAGTEDAVISYDYDANGNLTQKENSNTDLTETYGYDAANQMTSYEVDGTVMQSNVYDGNGQRIQKTAGSDVTNYFYGDSGLLYTTDGNGSLKALQHYDAYGDLFANSTVSENTESQYYYTDDIRGSIVNLVDGNNAAVVSYTYTDFGETTEVQSGSIENEIRFTGGVYDEESGLYYLNARFYNPANGRFLNPDSYRGEAADPQTLHLYVYCANNPITHIDPTGHALETVVDVAFLGMSINDFRKSPTTENFIYVVWDGVATILPFVAGSYMVKGAKVLAKADITAELRSVGLADRISDAAKTVTTKVKTAFSNVKQTIKTTKSVVQTGKTTSSSLKKLYRTIKDAPEYPKNFVARKNGTTMNTVNNIDLLEELRKYEAGTWKKVYKDGYDANGKKISIHYFQSKSGKVFNVKVKSGWSNK